MIEAWRTALDEKKKVGPVMTDLSKAFDCLNHDLLIAKFNAYGFEKGALELINSYLKKEIGELKLILSLPNGKN